jgi:DNA-binding response OmpR family regulator
MLILVVDDDPMTGKMLRFLFSEEGYEVHVEPHVMAARAYLARRQPDLMIMDVMMPGTDGFEFCRQLRAEGFAKPIIFLTARIETADKVSGLHIGGDDYLVKPFEPAELLARAQAVLRRASQNGHFSQRTRLRAGGLELNVSALEATLPDGKTAYLTPTEMRFLECLMHNAGRVVTRDMLVDWVWGYDYEGESNRVEVYIRRLRQKLGDDSAAPRYIETLRGSGYRLRPALVQGAA